MADYIGYPIRVVGSPVSALPFRAYCQIYNDWFRDENLQQCLAFSKDSAHIQGFNPGTVTISGTSYDYSDPVIGCIRGACCAKICKVHDYFTSCLPAPQKGDASGINIDIGNVKLSGDFEAAYKSFGASVIPFSSNSASPNYSYGEVNLSWNDYWNRNNLYPNGVVPSSSTGFHFSNASTSTTPNTDKSFDGRFSSGSGYYDVYGVGLSASQAPSAGGNMLFDGSKGTLTFTGKSTAGTPANVAVSVNDLRNAFAIQRLLEKDARGGTRYTEILATHFGVHSPDARLQRAEYLGGFEQLLGVQQIAQTSASTSTSPQANLSAFGYTHASSSRVINRSFVEHG